MEQQFVGEHLFPGQLGNIFVILSFVAAMLATFSYYKASREHPLSDSWKRIARIAFRLHSVGVLGIIGTLFYLLINQYFEYHYVWFHSNTEMPMRYVLAAFWEGQEGSFLLWTFWHVVLGNILIRTAKTWEAPVMTVFSSVQAFLSTMV
ncbi:MAG: cytochrome C biogenesis protein, partial [Bacteroidota bacterium]